MVITVYLCSRSAGETKTNCTIIKTTIVGLFLNKYNMKKILTLVALVAAGLTASAQHGVGVHLGYGSNTEKMSFGAKYQYAFTKNWRGEAVLDYSFMPKNTTFWTVGVNAHYIFQLEKDFSVYPTAGLYNAHASVGSVSDNELGVAFGGGAQYHFNKKFTGFFEAKYMTAGSGQAGLFAGVVYNF
ncbi:MAG: outer membrane beta-barrel protein [Bacteroidales bacterium]|nr:outer membrane beta-barrel protein [Bacteroidales bacterium]